MENIRFSFDLSKITFTLGFFFIRLNGIHQDGIKISSFVHLVGLYSIVVKHKDWL